MFRIISVNIKYFLNSTILRHFLKLVKYTAKENCQTVGGKKSFPLQNLEEYGTVEVSIHSFIIWALDGVSSQLHAAAALPPVTEFTTTIK